MHFSRFAQFQNKNDYCNMQTSIAEKFSKDHNSITIMRTFDVNTYEAMLLLHALSHTPNNPDLVLEKNYFSFLIFCLPSSCHQLLSVLLLLNLGSAWKRLRHLLTLTFPNL